MSDRAPADAPPMLPVNDLGRHVAALRPVIDEALQRVLERGWFVLGPEVERFEGDLAAFVGCAHAVGVANGTDAIELALRAVGVDAGHEVVTVANAGGYATAAIRSIGAVPRYVDVGEGDLLVDPDGVVGALRTSTRAVVVTHLYGQLAPVEQVATACRERGVAVVEDCAQAIGASRGGARAGSFGDAAAFSFYPTKNLGCLGDGGAVVTHDATVARSVRELRQYGWSGKYRSQRPGGRNSRLDEMQAALLGALLPMLDGWNARRRTIVGRYADAAGGRVRVLGASGGPDTAAHLAVVVTARRADLVAQLDAAGIACDVHYPVPDHWQRGHEGEVPALPVTERASTQVLTLPCFPEMTDEEVARVQRVLAG